MTKLAFKGGTHVKQADYLATKRRTRIQEWLERFNNVTNVQLGERGQVTFEASKFAAEGIARESGFDVHHHGGNKYALDIRQSRVGAKLDREESQGVFTAERRQFLIGVLDQSGS